MSSERDANSMATEIAGFGEGRTRKGAFDTLDRIGLGAAAVFIGIGRQPSDAFRELEMSFGLPRGAMEDPHAG